MPFRALRRTLTSALLVVALSSHAVAAPEDDEWPVASRPAAPPAPVPAVVDLKVVGFSAANAEVIQATKPLLDQRLGGLEDSGGYTVQVELAPGSGGALVVVEERMAGPLDGLGLVRGPMGMRALQLARPLSTATMANVWVSLGPVRAAMDAGNMPLVTALGSRAMVVRYVNAQGAVLALSFVPSRSGQAMFEGVAITEGKTTTQVAVDPSSGLLPLPVGADGKPMPSARVYAFFGEPVQ